MEPLGPPELKNSSVAGLGQKLEVISWMRSLADPDQFALCFLGTGNLQISDLYDLIIVDMSLDNPDPERLQFVCIGPKESECLGRISVLLNTVVKDTGVFQKNAAYISHVLWPEVIGAAEVSLKVLLAPK